MAPKRDHFYTRFAEELNRQQKQGKLIAPEGPAPDLKSATCEEIATFLKGMFEDDDLDSQQFVKACQKVGLSDANPYGS